MSNNTTQVTTLLKDPGYPWCLHAGNKSLSQFLDRVTEGIVKAAADLLLTIDPSDLEWLHTTKGHFHFYLPPGLRCVKAKIARKKYKQFPWYGEEVLIKAHLVKNEQTTVGVSPRFCRLQSANTQRNYEHWMRQFWWFLSIISDYCSILLLLPNPPLIGEAGHRSTCCGLAIVSLNTTLGTESTLISV